MALLTDNPAGTWNRLATGWVVRRGWALGVLLVCVLQLYLASGLLAQGGQVKVSPALEEVIGRFAAGDYVYAGLPPMDNALRVGQYEAYEAFVRVSTEAELKALLGHARAPVRCYAFAALAERPGCDLVALFKGRLGDKGKVDLVFGNAIHTGLSVASFCSRALLNPNMFPRIPTAGVDAAERIDSMLGYYVDSLLVYGPAENDDRVEAIRRLPALPRHHAVFLRLVEEGEESALPRLASYRRAADVPVLLKGIRASKLHLGEGMGAIETYPHAQFWPYLMEQWRAAKAADKYNVGWMTMYYAIAAYDNAAAYDVLLSVVKDEGTIVLPSFHLRYVFLCLAKYRLPRYDEVSFLLWERHRYININALRYLYGRDKGRCVAAIKGSAEVRYFQNFPDYGPGNWVGDKELREEMSRMAE